MKTLGYLLLAYGLFVVLAGSIHVHLLASLLAHIRFLGELRAFVVMFP